MKKAPRIAFGAVNLGVAALVGWCVFRGLPTRWWLADTGGAIVVTLMAASGLALLANHARAETVTRIAAGGVNAPRRATASRPRAGERSHPRRPRDDSGRRPALARRANLLGRARVGSRRPRRRARRQDRVGDGRRSPRDAGIRPRLEHLRPEPH